MSRVCWNNIPCHYTRKGWLNFLWRCPSWTPFFVSAGWGTGWRITWQKSPKSEVRTWAKELPKKKPDVFWKRSNLFLTRRRENSTRRREIFTSRREISTRRRKILTRRREIFRTKTAIFLKGRVGRFFSFSPIPTPPPFFSISALFLPKSHLCCTEMI